MSKYAYPVIAKTGDYYGLSTSIAAVREHLQGLIDSRKERAAAHGSTIEHRLVTFQPGGDGAAVMRALIWVTDAYGHEHHEVFTAYRSRV